MQKVFLAVIDMSIVSSLVILAVLLVRALLKRAPRRFAYVLWAAVLLRLLCPFAVESPLSLIPESAGEIAQSAALPEAENVSFVSAASAAYRAIGDTAGGGEDFIRVEVAAPAVVQVGGQEPERQYVSASHGQVWLLLCAWLWPAGTAAVLVWGIAGQIRLRRMLVGAVKLEGEVWLADHIPTAFVMGLVRPKIYLPSDLDGPGRDYVLAHERAHVRRGDHITRLLAFAALAMHWFNPLVWLAFAMSGRDMEMSCDEAVMRRSGADIRADYCQTLLDMSANKHFPSPCLLAFGESDTGARVRNALRWKKPAFWAVCSAAVLIIAACVLLLTNPARKGDNTVELSFPAYQDGRIGGFGEQMVYDVAYDKTPFTMSVTLPKGWTAETPEELRARTAGDSGDLSADGCALYTPVQLYDERGKHAGFVGWSDYAPYDGDDVPEGDFYKTVYYSLRLGAHYGWEDFEELKGDQYTGTHTATVYYQTPVEGMSAAAWPQHTAPGVCHYDKRLNVYVAIQLDAGAATEKEILEMADSIALSASEPADAAGSQTVKVYFPGHYVEDVKVLDSGPFTASLTLPEGWGLRGGWSLVPEGTNGEGYSPVYLTDPEGVTVGKMTYRIFDPDNPAQVYRAGSWSDQEYARIRYCNDLYRNSSWQDYESVAYTDTAETFKATVIRSVQVNDATAKGYHFETETRYGVGRYDTELGVYVTLELRAARVSERDAEIIAKSLELEPVGLTSASCYFNGWDYSDGERGFRRGKGDFIANMNLPEGWSVRIPDKMEGFPDIHGLLGPVNNIYDENGECVAWVAWAGFDPDAYTDDTVDHGLSTAINMSLAERTDWAQRGWEQFFTNSYSGTAYIYEIVDGDGVDTGRCGVCAYDGAKEVYVVVEFADGQAYDWAARIIAGSLRLQSFGSNDGRKVFINSGYSTVNGVRVESKPYSAQITLPKGWTATIEVTPEIDMGTAGLEPWEYMFDAEGNYAGFIAVQSPIRPIQANHYEWEYDEQVLGGNTEIYTTSITYDVFDESLLPGYAWNSFDTVGIWARNEAMDVYVMVQFVPGAVSKEDLYDMARSITFKPGEVEYIPCFGGVDWGTDGRTMTEDFDSVFFGERELSTSWSFLGRDCEAVYEFGPDGLLNGGVYSLNSEGTLSREEAIDLYKQMLAELEDMYGEAGTPIYLEDLTPMDIQSVIDGKSDMATNSWTKQAPGGNGVDIYLSFKKGGVYVSYSLLYEKR